MRAMVRTSQKKGVPSAPQGQKAGSAGMGGHRGYGHLWDSQHRAPCSLLPEPAILVMHHSMKPHPAITATLLDFMCRVSRPSLSGEFLGLPNELHDEG